MPDFTITVKKETSEQAGQGTSASKLSERLLEPDEVSEKLRRHQEAQQEDVRNNITHTCDIVN
jgi:hypothetical protein